MKPAAASTDTPFFFKYQNSDYYNLQADAFLHGRLSLDVPVDPRLLSAKNPYALDVPDTVPGLVDAPFYHGKWYLSWGPAPALTTFLPPRLLGLRIQENLAVTLYAFIGVLCGWYTAEIGRQPYVVYGLMRTADAFSGVELGSVIASLATFLIVYAIVFGFGTWYLLKLLRKGPIQAPPLGTITQTPARPMSASEHKATP